MTTTGIVVSFNDYKPPYFKDIYGYMGKKRPNNQCVHHQIMDECPPET